MTVGVNITRPGGACATMGLAVSLVLGLWPAQTVARPAFDVRQEVVDELVLRHLDSRHIPAASIAVVSKGKLLSARGYGVANVELAAPASENTVYELASITKQFTAVAVMTLVEQGRLSLDDRVSRFIEGPDAWSEITVRQLLNHTSGLESNDRLPELNDQIDHSQRHVLDLVAERPLAFAPGTQQRYSNMGYFMLGVLIEEISGVSYGDFLQQQIFQPLGMTSTRLNDRSLIMPQRAAGYEWQEPDLHNAARVSPTVSYAGGGLITTAVDLARWEQALYQRRLLQEGSYEQLWNGAVLADGQVRPYGMGWWLDAYRDQKRAWHGGSIPGFDTYMVRFVEDDLTVIVLTNLVRSGSDHIAHSIAELYLPELRARAPKPIHDQDPETTAFLRQVITSAAQGTARPEWFTAEWNAFFFPDRVKEGVAMLGTFGPLNSFELWADTTADGHRLREHLAVFGMVKVRCRFKLTEDGRIAEIGIGKRLANHE